MFEYVPKREYELLRDHVEQVIKNVQKAFRKKNILTFQFYRIGSAGDRDLITREINGNKGFDFDYNFEIEKYNKDYYNPKILNYYLSKLLTSILAQAMNVQKILHRFLPLKILIRQIQGFCIVLILQ